MGDFFKVVSAGPMLPWALPWALQRRQGGAQRTAPKAPRTKPPRHDGPRPGHAGAPTQDGDGGTRGKGERGPWGKGPTADASGCRSQDP